MSLPPSPILPGFCVKQIFFLILHYYFIAAGSVWRRQDFVTAALGRAHRSLQAAALRDTAARPNQSPLWDFPAASRQKPEANWCWCGCWKRWSQQKQKTLSWCSPHRDQNSPLTLTRTRRFCFTIIKMSLNIKSVYHMNINEWIRIWSHWNKLMRLQLSPPVSEFRKALHRG